MTDRSDSTPTTSVPRAVPNGVAFVDGRFRPLAEAGVPLLDWGFLHSDATYDVVHVWRRRFFRLDRHLDRFAASQAKLRLSVPHDRQTVAGILAECVRRAGFDDASVYMICTRGNAPDLSRDPRRAVNRFFAFAQPFVRVLRPENQERGLHAAISSIRRIPPESLDPTAKNYHWLDLVMGQFEAFEAGADTALLVDERGDVVEGPGFNVFAITDGRAVTPARGALEGITRATVLELCLEAGIPAVAEPLTAAALRGADEAFVTTTAGGLAPLTRVDGRPLGHGRPGPVTHRLTALYWKKHDDPAWTTPLEACPFPASTTSTAASGGGGAPVQGGPSLADVEAARDRVAGIAIETPLVPSLALSDRCGAPVRLKLETLQPIGAFKVRGAANALAALPPDVAARGVACASTGNHGRGVAYAARRLGVPATVCLSRLVPANKVDAIRALGATVRIVGDSQDDAQIEVDRLVREEGLSEIPPFDHADVIAGQGTIGLEILEAWPEVEQIVVPLSGGGLLGGIALAAKAVKPSVSIVGVSMSRGAAMRASLEAGHPVDVVEVETLADSLGGGIGLANRFTFDLVRRLVDAVVLLDEAEIAAGMRWLLAREGLMVEGGGAVGVGALISGRLTADRPTALVISGRNVAPDRFLDLVAATPDA